MPATASSNLRNETSAKLLALLVSGQIRAGRINESYLAGRMRVSRTPLREALVSLESRGFVVSLDRGFAVPALHAIEIRDIYPIIARLETLALETAGLPDKTALSQLRRLNRTFRRSGVKCLAALDADNRFHAALLAHCPNERLLKLIERQKLLARRYELLYFRRAEFFARSAEQHENISELLSRGDVESAMEVLAYNWNCALDLLLRFVRE